MLPKRYISGSDPIITLSTAQRAIRDQIEAKVTRSHYLFEEHDCPVCDQRNLEQVAQRDRYGLKCPVTICRSCGLIQTNPRMTKAAYKEFYDCEFPLLYRGEATPSRDRFISRKGYGALVENWLKVNGAIDKPSAETFLVDVGCSLGGVVAHFHEAGYKAMGVELNAEYVAYGRRIHGLDLRQGTLATLDLEHTPDIVIYCQVFEHVLDPVAELEALARIAGPQTFVYIEVPGIRNLFLGGYHMDFLRLLQNAHVWHFSLRSLTNLCRRAGWARVVGDERVRALYRFDPALNRNLFENDYEAARAWLATSEQLRKFYPTALMRWAARVVRSGSRVLGR